MATKTTTTKGVNLDDAIDDFKNFFTELNKNFFERDFEISQIMYALMVKEHVLFTGVPGAAKSDIARTVFSNIEGARVYSAQFSRFMDEAYLFGPQLVEDFKKGIIRHNTKDSIVDSHFAFLDEFLNASEELICSTNEVLNERTFTRQAQREESDLMVAIMTTNQERESEKELRAYYDRVMFKSNVVEVAEQGNRLKMYQAHLSQASKKLPKMQLEGIKAIQEAVYGGKIRFSTAMLTFYDLLLTEYSGQAGIYVSPRKKNKMLYLPIAYALLTGKDEVDMECVAAIKYVLVQGGNAKQIGWFDSVFKKSESTFQNFDVVLKVNKLFEETVASNFDRAEKTRRFMGIKKKTEKMIQEMQSTPAAGLIKTLEEISINAQKELDKMGDVPDEDIFKGTGPKKR